MTVFFYLSYYLPVSFTDGVNDQTVKQLEDSKNQGGIINKRLRPVTMKEELKLGGDLKDIVKSVRGNEFP